MCLLNSLGDACGVSETPVWLQSHFLLEYYMSEAEKVVPADEQVEEKPVVVAEAEKKVEEEREEPDSDNNMDANKESEKKKKKKKKSKKKVTGRVFVRLLIPRFH